MAKRKRRRYNPIKEVKSITGTTTGVLIGTYTVSKIHSDIGSTANVYPALGMMSTIPTVQAGGSLIRSLDMLNVKPKKRRKRRR